MPATCRLFVGTEKGENRQVSAANDGTVQHNLSQELALRKVVRKSARHCRACAVLPGVPASKNVTRSGVFTCSISSVPQNWAD